MIASLEGPHELHAERLALCAPAGVVTVRLRSRPRVAKQLTHLSRQRGEERELGERDGPGRKAVRHQPGTRVVVEAALRWCADTPSAAGADTTNHSRRTPRLAPGQIHALIAARCPRTTHGEDALLRHSVEAARKRRDGIQRRLLDHHLVAYIERAVEIEEHTRRAAAQEENAAGTRCVVCVAANGRVTHGTEP